MRTLRLLAFCLPIAVAGCGSGASNNAGNAVNIAEEEGVEDLNSSIEGDQYSPLPEAADDTMANRSGPPATKK
jgi:hypothetical protein